MKTLVDYLLEKRKENEGDFERSANNVADRALTNFARIKFADDIANRFMAPSHSDDDTLKRLQVLKLSRELNLNPDAVTSGDIYSQEAKPFSIGRGVTKTRIAAAHFDTDRKAYPEARSLMGALLSGPVPKNSRIAYDASKASTEGFLAKVLRRKA